jgi:LDH2 family malate/lactate/ureidoglycolate dehydrogenase
VRVPGDLERAAAVERTRDGIPVDPDLLRTIHQLTEEPAFVDR